MSRVEKYREYRSEIAALPDQPNQTKKHQSSQRVDKLLENKKGTTKLGFEDVYEGLDIYNVRDNTERTHPNYARRNLIIFYCCMGLVILGLIIALIFVGKEAFGG